MARLKTERIVCDKNGERVDFNTTINVDKEGNFTTTIPEDKAEYLKYRGIKLQTNRRGRAGFYTADTLNDLLKDINTDFNEAMSMVLDSSITVIRYAVTTKVSYCLSRGTEGEVVPNGIWVENNYNYQWLEGSKTKDSFFDSGHFGIQLFVEVQNLNKYRLKSGKEILKYEEVKLEGSRFDVPTKNDPQYYLKWLKGVRGMGANGVRLKDIPYTENRAKVFVDMIKGIARITRNLDFMQDTETLIELADSNLPLKLD